MSSNNDMKHTIQVIHSDISYPPPWFTSCGLFQLLHGIRSTRRCSPAVVLMDLSCTGLQGNYHHTLMIEEIDRIDDIVLAQLKYWSYIMTLMEG